MPSKGNAEYLIEDVAGCGPFQVILFLFAILISHTTVSYSILFMSFGNYNPGWRCLDNVTSHTPNNSTILESTTINSTTSLDYTQGSCDVYRECHKVEFNPESSTVVSEWGLLCDHAWMSSLTISIQMLGMLVGSFVGGQLSDLFGRKIIFYGFCAFAAICHLISSFSVSLVMLIVLRFFIGGSAICVMVVMFIYLVEFMTDKWRVMLMTLPVWYLGGTLQALVSMATKDWRTVELVGCGLFVLSFISIVWVPESLRWLEVKKKPEQFLRVAKKVVKYNKKVLPSFENLNSNLDKDRGEKKNVKKYTMLDMFRPGYKLITLCVGFLDFAFSMIYYSLTFGIKSLYGDFYINLILFNIIAIPIFLCGMVLVKYTSRISMSVLFLGISVVCAIGATGCLLSESDQAKATGSTVLLSVAKSTLDATWLCLYARVTELYPTVIQTTALGFASLTARVGGILAPFIIPNEKSSMYIFIIISAAVILFCCFVSYKLPETKGRQLKETFENSDEKGIDNENDDTTKEQEC